MEENKSINTLEEIQEAFSLIETEIIFNPNLSTDEYNELLNKLNEIKEKLCSKLI